MNGQIGKYRIDGVLGKGAMGVVYKAFDLYIQRVVALKTISKELFGDSQQADLISRFKNEAQAAGRLNHPNIVMVYDYGEDNESAYIAMEFVDGAPLNAVIRPGQRTDTQRIKAWMSDLLLALQYAHSRGVVHRDIKPSNLMITLDDRVKVSDFGIAHIDSSTLTQTGSVIGTPSYMSPEQFRGEPADARSDLFSAGVVLYQLLCGVRPFSGSASAVMHQILNVTPSPPSLQLASLGNGYDQVVERAIAKAREDRYATACEFLNALIAVEDPVDSAADGTVIVMHDSSRLFDSVQCVPADSDHTMLQDDDRTILIGSPQAFAQPHPILPATTTNSNPGSIDTQWKVAVLPEVERILSYQIGPIARVLARKSLARANSLDELCSLLLQHIPSQPGRAQFQQAAGQLSKKLVSDCTGSRPGLSSSTDDGKSREPYIDFGIETLRSAPSAQETFDDAWAEVIAQRLIILVGPIARIIVKRAARQTRDRNEFLKLLAEHIESASDRARFLVDVSVFRSR